MMRFPHHVEFTDSKDAPAEIVREFCVMPSGAIVVMTDAGDSLWFDAEGKHPKSRLVFADRNDKEWPKPPTGTILMMGIIDKYRLRVEFFPCFKTAETWGIALCDAARHLANCYGNKEHRNPEEVLAEIVHEFMGELDEPTSGLSGWFENRT